MTKQEIEKRVVEINSELSDLKLNADKLQNEMDGLIEILNNMKEPEVEEWPKEGDKYYYIYNTGAVGPTYWSDGCMDKGRLSVGNIFRTKKGTEEAIEHLKVFRKLMAFSDPDGLWAIKYIKPTGNIAEAYDCCNLISPIRFKTGHDVRKAIEAVGADRIKWYYFGIKE